jgi:hypothetical protein
MIPWMRKRILFIVFCFASIFILQAQTADTYRRSSLYSILIKHAEKEFCPEIIEVFNSIPIPDKFDDHNLNMCIVNAYVPPHLEKNKEVQKQGIETFLSQNDIGRRMIAKWFNRNKNSGSFDMNLVAQRGLYDASILDIQVAAKSTRGRAILADAGEELIGNTYVIVNDIRYLDKAEASYMATVFGKTTKAVSSKNVADFEVNITSYLYRLDWTEEIAATFYQSYYMDRHAVNANRKAAFDNDRNTFTITYFGSQTVVSSGKTSMRGINTKANAATIKREMIKKVCTRAIDAAIVQLQRTYDEFKVKTPLISADPIKAYIGRKEGVSEDTKYEVLEKNEDENGRTFYERVGIIQPVKDKIWDNRYLSVDEGFDGAAFGITEFVKISGDDFYTGMLIREIK